MTPRPAPITDAERAELLRLFLAGTQGAWHVPRFAAGRSLVLAGDEFSPRRVASFDREQDADSSYAVSNARTNGPQLVERVESA